MISGNIFNIQKSYYTAIVIVIVGNVTPVMNIAQMDGRFG